MKSELIWNYRSDYGDKFKLEYKNLKIMSF